MGTVAAVVFCLLVCLIESDKNQGKFSFVWVFWHFSPGFSVFVSTAATHLDGNIL